MRRLCRDRVVSMTDEGDLVGVYWEGEDGSDILFDCHPDVADQIIELYNGDAERRQNGGEVIKMTIQTLAEKVAAYNRGGAHMLSKLTEIQQRFMDTIPHRFSFKRGSVGYATHYKSSRIGSWDYVLCFVPSHAQGVGEWHPIPDEWNQAGSEGYVHGDFNTWYSLATRMEIKIIAKQMPDFIEELLAHFAEQEEEFKEAEELLTKMLDAVK